MSLSAMKWVFDHSQTRGSARVLMLVIADMANDDGECWPGKAKLAKKVNVLPRQITKLIQECERLKELAVIPHTNPDGAQTSNRYLLTKFADARRLKEARSVKIKTPPGVLEDTPPVSYNALPPGVLEDTQNQSNETKDKQLPVAPDGTTDSGYQDFLDKLTAQPSQVTRPAGLKANPNNPHVKALEARIEGGEPDDEALLVKAVETTLRLYGQTAVVYAKMLLGKRGRGEFNTYRMDVPVTATELQDWAMWYERQNAGLNKPTTPMKLSSSILEYRAAQANPQAARRDDFFTFGEG